MKCTGDDIASSGDADNSRQDFPDSRAYRFVPGSLMACSAFEIQVPRWWGRRLVWATDALTWICRRSRFDQDCQRSHMKLWARLSSILDARLVRLEEAVRSGKKEDESRDQRTSYALSWIVLASAIGLFASAAYGISFSSRGAILALLASILGYAAGGLLGFLFGFPRYTENAPVQSADDLKAAARGQDAAAA